MMRMMVLPALLTAALCVLTACQVAPEPTGPQPGAEDMRSALKQMLAAHPDLALPEFADALQYDHPVNRDGRVCIGNWSCDPRNLSFEAVLTSPNITLYDLTGRFEEDKRGNWRAIPHEPTIVTHNDVDGFWRASEMDPVGN
jgi:hypothetical protein